jgi:hypothetical protein
MAEVPSLPALPVKLDQLLSFIEQQNTTNPIKLFKPYRDYDAQIRELYAQDAGSVSEGHSNVVGVFDGPALKTRARKLDTESAGEKDCYIMPLENGQRRAEGSPATVDNTKEFKKNFNIFTEMSLSDLDWSNVVVAGSAALTPLLPYEYMCSIIEMMLTFTVFLRSIRSRRGPSESTITRLWRPLQMWTCFSMA